MKIVAGIAPQHDMGPLISLIAQLRFSNMETICASIAPIPMTSPAVLTAWPDELYSQLMEAERTAACHALERATDDFKRLGIPCEQIYEVGDPAFHLGAIAQSRHADVVAIGSREVGTALSFVLGSVGRALTIKAKQTLLIAKRPHGHEESLKAVFAFDGSDYCLRSVDELVRLRPAGLSHIELLTVDTPDPDSSPVTRMRGLGAFELGRDRRHEMLLESAEPALTKLRDAGYEVRSVCHSGEVTETIRSQVIDSAADLVILGAQGHGWIERVFFGSVALAQVVGEPHSVLILRPRTQ